MWAETKTSICNKALMLVGEDAINSLEDNTTQQARIVNSFYDLSLRSVLESGKWPFATVEAEVQRIDIDSYTKEQKFIYRIPTDCSLIVGVYKRYDRKHMPKRIDWDLRYVPELKSSVVICNAKSFTLDDIEEEIYQDDQILVEYISSAPTSYSYSAAFVKCVVAQLAADICMPITHDQQRFATMQQYAAAAQQQALQQALNEDGQDKQRWIDPITASRGW